MSEVDVVVVGAGAAGLAAGRVLQQAGVSFRVLEAKPRIGGRAFTDSQSFGGIPFDHGCHWLHSASRNPLRVEADRLGVRYRTGPSFEPRRLALGGRLAGEDELAGLEAAYDRFYAEIGALADLGQDVAASQAFAPAEPWRAVVANGFSLASSADPEQTSLLDNAYYCDTGEDYPVESGLGALVARLADGLPVNLSTPVTGIDWSGKRVRVVTAAGTLSARVVILGVSTTLIQRGTIALSPALPAPIADAIAHCQLGAAEKVAFLLDQPLAEVPQQSFLTSWHPADPARHPVSFYCNQFGQPIISAYLGGSFCRDLEASGEAAMIDFALAHLCDLFGAAFRKRIRRMLATHWGSDPHIGGAYSVVTPGHAAARQQLQEVFSDRLLLAGEATAGEFYSTAHGAHLTGQRAAARAVAALAGGAAR